nr:unnamed protein product [Spirometra erinaceieuropaei]
MRTWENYTCLRFVEREPQHQSYIIFTIKACGKRKLRNVDDEAWDCSVCTYKNSPEAFRCEMCQTRKGTSTRKPKLNPQIVEEQSFIARAIIKEREEEGLRKRRETRGTAGTGGGGGGANASAGGGGVGGNAGSTDCAMLLPSLCNVDRSSPLLFEIFANGYSVVITEYQPKVTAARSSISVADSPVPSNSSSLLGFTSTPLGVNSGQMSPVEQPQSQLSSTRGACQFTDFPDVDDSFVYAASRSVVGSRPMNTSPACCDTGSEDAGVRIKTDPSRRSNFTNSVAQHATADVKPFAFSASSSSSSVSSTSSVPCPTPPREDRLQAFVDSSLPVAEETAKPALMTLKPSAHSNDVQTTPTPARSCPSSFRGAKGRLKRRFPHSMSDATDSATTIMEQEQQEEEEVKVMEAPVWGTKNRSKKRRFSTPKSLHVSPSFSRLVSPRSLRSHLGSNTRQASRVARASLYQNTDQLRPPRTAHKRRKLLSSQPSLAGTTAVRRTATGSVTSAVDAQKNHHPKPSPGSLTSALPGTGKQAPMEVTTAASVPPPSCQSIAVTAAKDDEEEGEVSECKRQASSVTAAVATSKTITINGCPSTESSKNTTAMTDSCGALTLEMSAV